jgi:hypothetical protein
MTSAENRQHASDEKGWHVTPPGANPKGTVLALLRVGTRRCRLAAAFMAVVIGLTAPTANGALAESRRTVLYLDAPAVSKDRALRAGELADAYADPRSPATRETLAWLGLPVRPADVSAPPEYAEAAFASVTAPDGEGAGGVTADAALRAGEVMLAQIDEGVSPKGRDGDEDVNEEMAAVRPELGDGTPVPDVEHVAEPATQPDGQPEPGGEVPADVGTPEYASTPAAPDPTGKPGEPSGGASIVVPAPLSVGEEQEEPSTELAAAPSYTDTSPEPAFGTEDEPYGPTGPVSDVGERPEKPYPDENNPAAEQPAGEDEFAQAGPVEEEPAEADPPAAPPDEPASPDTGPTVEEGDEIALVPVSVRAKESEDPTGAPPPVAPPAGNGPDDFASAEPSPAAVDASQGSFQQAEIVIEDGEPPADASPGVPSSEGRYEEGSIAETRVQEMTIVQESETGATVEVAPADDSGDEADGRSGSDTTGGTGEEGLQRTHEPSAGGSGHPTDQPDHPDEANRQPSPEESVPSPTPTAGGPSETADQPGDGAKGPSNEPTAGDQTSPADETGTRSGDPQGEIPQGDAPQSPARTRDEPAGDDTQPPDQPNAGGTRDPRRHDHDASGPRDAGAGRPVGPIGQRTKEDDDGDRAMQERARNPVDLSEGGGAPSLAVREAKPEERVGPQSLQRDGSRGAPRGSDLHMLQNSLGSARGDSSGPSRTPRGTGGSERTLGGTGRGDTEEVIQQGSPGSRISARQTAETQTYTQPEPAVSRQAEQVYREPVQQVAPEPLDAAHQVNQPVREAVPTADAAPEQPAQQAPHGGVQAVQPTETINRAAGQ